MSIEEEDIPAFIEFIQNDYYAFGQREPELLIQEWKRIKNAEIPIGVSRDFYCAEVYDKGERGKCPSQCGNCKHAE